MKWKGDLHARMRCIIDTVIHKMKMFEYLKKKKYPHQSPSFSFVQLWQSLYREAVKTQCNFLERHVRD